ncbi:hypothetical protein CVT24_009054 [Panaeolus cyanescens]|uniref:Uncharacterized protein n=1 Tax=Panaeolus cyanescens TaxID=181874 RepID=A0A409WEJ5_9AGAR|nr:hypothetical protein CVT24_009054 [Panaeolus cyanescens]
MKGKLRLEPSSLSVANEQLSKYDTCVPVAQQPLLYNPQRRLQSPVVCEAIPSNPLMQTPSSPLITHFLMNNLKFGDEKFISFFQLPPPPPLAPPLQPTPSKAQNLSCFTLKKMEISLVMMLVLLGGFFLAMCAISVFKDVYWRHRARNRVARVNQRTRRSAGIENGQTFILDLPLTNNHVYPPLPHPNERENRVHLAPARRVNVTMTRVDDDRVDFFEDKIN